MKKYLIKNIGLLKRAEDKDSGTVRDISNAYLAIEGNQIIAFDRMDNWRGITDWRNLEIIDADNSLIYSLNESVIDNVTLGEFKNIIISISQDNLPSINIPLTEDLIKRRLPH